MKPALIALFTIYILLLSAHKIKPTIALQPLDDYCNIQLADLQKELSVFYHTQVTIMPPVTIPQTYFNTRLRQYSADSIVLLLSKLQNDNQVQIVGITNRALFTIKESKTVPIPYFDENVFGFGYLPGSDCVVSAYKLKTADSVLFLRRLRNVAIHEIGHNLGLQHCPNANCIMSETMGRVSALDREDFDYCSACKKKLKEMHSPFAQ